MRVVPQPSPCAQQVKELSQVPQYIYSGKSLSTAILTQCPSQLIKWQQNNKFIKKKKTETQAHIVS